VRRIHRAGFFFLKKNPLAGNVRVFNAGRRLLLLNKEPRGGLNPTDPSFFFQVFLLYNWEGDMSAIFETITVIWKESMLFGSGTSCLC